MWHSCSKNRHITPQADLQSLDNGLVWHIKGLCLSAWLLRAQEKRSAQGGCSEGSVVLDPTTHPSGRGRHQGSELCRSWRPYNGSLMLWKADDVSFAGGWILCPSRPLVTLSDHSEHTPEVRHFLFRAGWPYARLEAFHCRDTEAHGIQACSPLCFQEAACPRHFTSQPWSMAAGQEWPGIAAWGLQCHSGHSIIATHGGGGSGHSPGQGRAWIVPQLLWRPGLALSHGLKPGTQWAGEPSESSVGPLWELPSLVKSP